MTRADRFALVLGLTLLAALAIRFAAFGPSPMPAAPVVALPEDTEGTAEWLWRVVEEADEVD